MSLEKSIDNHTAAITRLCDLIEAGKFVVPASFTQGGVVYTSGETPEPSKKGGKGSKATKTPPPTETPADDAGSPPDDAPEQSDDSTPKEVSLDDLKKVGTALVAAEKKTEFIALLRDKFNVPKIGDLEESQYPAALAGLESLLGKKLDEIAD